MIIYSFDTGISTGVAKFNTSTYDVILTTLTIEELLGTLQDDKFISDYVILERIPESSGFELLLLSSEVIKTCSYLNIPCRRIAPSSWKPLAKAQKWKCESSSTQHEYDAYALLRYFYLTSYREDLGDI